jgi:hypothetical protein
MTHFMDYHGYEDGYDPDEPLNDATGRRSKKKGYYPE